MIGIDTYSWYKLLLLLNEGWKDLIEEVLQSGQFFVTNEVKKEVEFRFKDQSHILRLVTILPLIDIDYDSYSKKGFDEADASLLEYNQRNGYLILTEDQAMIAEGVTENKTIIQLADFFGLLMRDGYVEAKEFYHIVKRLRKMRNITKKKEKELLEFRNSTD